MEFPCRYLRKRHCIIYYYIRSIRQWHVFKRNRLSVCLLVFVSGHVRTFVLRTRRGLTSGCCTLAENRAFDSYIVSMYLWVMILLCHTISAPALRVSWGFRLSPTSGLRFFHFLRNLDTYRYYYYSVTYIGLQYLFFFLCIYSLPQSLYQCLSQVGREIMCSTYLWIYHYICIILPPFSKRRHMRSWHPVEWDLVSNRMTQSDDSIMLIAKNHTNFFALCYDSNHSSGTSILQSLLGNRNYNEILQI